MLINYLEVELPRSQKLHLLPPIVNLGRNLMKTLPIFKNYQAMIEGKRLTRMAKSTMRAKMVALSSRENAKMQRIEALI